MSATPAGVLLLLHGDAGDGGAGQLVVGQAQGQQLVGQGRARDGGVQHRAGEVKKYLYDRAKILEP